MNDGGPAFPRLHHDGNSGMTLRDYFAAAALQGELAQHYWLPNNCEILAQRCYRFADAMLAERERK